MAQAFCDNLLELVVNSQFTGVVVEVILNLQLAIGS